MHSSKLVAFLRTFDANDMRRADDFLASPYFNRNVRLLALFRALRATGPGLPDARCDRYAIWEAAHPGEAGSDTEIAAEMNALLRLLEAFVGVERYQSMAGLRDLHMLEAFEARKLDKNFRLQLKRLQQGFAATAAQDEHHFLLRYQVAGVEVRYALSVQVRTHDTHLQEMVDFLDDHYLISRLRLTCELINRQNILSGAFNTRLAGGLMAYLRNYEHEKVPTMAAYYLVLRLLTGEGEADDFPRLSHLLRHETRAFAIEDWANLFSYAQNYCIRRVRLGESNYLRELFSLYRGAMEVGRLLENGALSAWKYKNIASVGLQLQEFAWVEEFIEQYRVYLPLEFRENAFAYNLAALQYHRGDYAAALRNLLRVEFTDVFYSLDTRKMMVMIYFEQGETDALLSLISSFRLYLRRNELVAEGSRRAYSNFLALVAALCREGEAVQTERMLARIAATQPLVEETWLQEKARTGFLGA